MRKKYSTPPKKIDLMVYTVTCTHIWLPKRPRQIVNQILAICKKGITVSYISLKLFWEYTFY